LLASLVVIIPLSFESTLLWGIEKPVKK